MTLSLWRRCSMSRPTPDVELVCVLVTGNAGLIPFAKSLLEDETIEYLVRGESVQDLGGVKCSTSEGIAPSEDDA